ncbi:1-aminocyclopropane-1-carboxylate oxidase 3-like [Wolffia australiana]
MANGMPVIDLGGLQGKKRKETMARFQDACENWGFFQVINHGIPDELVDRMKKLTHKHHDAWLKPAFEESEIAKEVAAANGRVNDKDWETCFFVQHLPASNAEKVPSISAELLETIKEYEELAAELAEKLLDLIGENLGLEKGYIKKAFSGESGPFMGTKFAKYPSCPKPDLVTGLRTHTDAGGIILVLQDDVPGLQFLKGADWVDVVPVPGGIFINTGDQLEVVTNGRVKSIAHRVQAQEDGGRISIATFYNPSSDAVIGPAPNLVYPVYKFEDYMRVYAGTKFADKEPRFVAMKDRDQPDTPLNSLVY